MIDIHSHILPGVDDGAQSLKDSIDMARLAVSEGIDTIIATPHHKNGAYENIRTKLLPEIDQLNEHLEKNQIPLKVLPGQEVRVYGELLEDLEQGLIQTINHSSYLLIEFPSNHIPRYASTLFFELQQKGINPILVHPERNMAIVENPNLLYDFVQKGVSTQLTCGSIAGKFGKKIKKVSMDLLSSNLIHFVSSDAHNVSTRQFWMNQALDEIEKQFGLDQIYYFEENAELLISGQTIMREMPQPVRQRKFLGLF
ncbi:tyrosine protein phosphatase [Pradoshia sp. D12]|uniref:tyrosine-protein phosphatase n=1 Tax=Bacillaceae TaxID=186817 RepID=UPI0011279A47|nr:MULTISPECIES: CpsB/CapC family capsule biosynthesis tyrosine phosphatase [Bacillaceae]QFK72934.1 tyrosine protein phosphatase [Pradoshia sp. D12]TPF71926.1 tyrosine protein phosphatase [Bacillus sp. D12]